MSGTGHPEGILFLTGPPASGKTAAAVELGKRLEARGIANAVADLDWLSWVHPVTESYDYNMISLHNLEMIWRTYHQMGICILILSRALLSDEPLERLEAIWPESRLTLVRLTASRKTLQERLRARDCGGELKEHLEELESMIEAMDRSGRPAVTVRNDGRDIGETAEEIIMKTGWLKEIKAR